MFHKIATTCVMVAALAACANPMQGPAAADAGAAAAAAERLRVAMVDPTRPALDALVADDLTYGHSGGRIDNKASFIGDLLDGKSDFVTIDITDQSVKVVRDVALVRHTLASQAVINGKPMALSLKVLQVWQQQNGQWKLLARQAVHPPA